MGSHESVVCREVNDDPGIPRPIQNGCDGTVEGAADETAGIQGPLVLKLLEDRREQIFRDSFAELHRYSLPLFRSPNRPSSALPGRSSKTEEWIELESGRFGSKMVGGDSRGVVKWGAGD